MASQALTAISESDQASIKEWFDTLPPQVDLEVWSQYAQRAEELLKKGGNVIFKTSLIEWGHLTGEPNLDLAKKITTFLEAFSSKYITDSTEKEETDQWVQDQKDNKIDTIGQLREENEDIDKLFKDEWNTVLLNELDPSSVKQIINFLQARQKRKERLAAEERAKAKAKAEAEEAKAKAVLAAQEAERKKQEEEKKSIDTAFAWDVRTCPNIVLTNEGKTLLRESGSGMTFRTTQGWTSGRHVWNIYIDNDASAGYIRCGFVTSDYPYQSGPSTTLLGDHKAAPGFWSGSPLYDASGFSKAPGCPANCPRYAPGSLLTFCLDLDTKEFFVDDLSSKSVVTYKKWYHNLPTGNGLIYYPAVSMYPNCKVTLKASLNT